MDLLGQTGYKTVSLIWIWEPDLNIKESINKPSLSEPAGAAWVNFCQFVLCF